PPPPPRAPPAGATHAKPPPSTHRNQTYSGDTPPTSRPRYSPWLSMARSATSIANIPVSIYDTTDKINQTSTTERKR
ncbi:hypothetical protein AB4142_32160, partial [Variovorax sp. 2RAF20]